MRIVDQISLPAFKISFFVMNNKYLVKFEAGPYEQTYKWDQDDFAGLEDLKQKINDSFLEKITEIFRSMHATATAI